MTPDPRPGFDAGVMSTTPKELARLWFDEVWNKRNTAMVRTLMHPQATGETEAALVRGPDDFLENHFTPLIAAFPDLRVELLGLLAEGEEVAVRWRVEATHSGALAGLPPSGRKVSFSGMTWLRFRDGLLAEGWDRWNAGALLQLLATGVPSFTVRTLT